jgi:putative polymerase
LLAILLILALAAALFEQLALDTFLKYFDVIHYYVARGTVTEDVGTDSGLFVSGTRFEERTLLSFLGDHRVSGIFLEPVSVGNFGAIAFAWVLLRDRRRPGPFIAKILVILTILVLADARFGFYLCVLTLTLYLAAPLIRPTMLLPLPFAAIVGLVVYAGVHWQDSVDNTIAGRFLFAGNLLATLTPWQVFGLQVNDAFMADAGYAYSLVKAGLAGLAALWALFVYTPNLDKDAWRFKVFIAFYVVFLLTVSTSLFSIKTAALVWFFYGTLNNPDKDPDEDENAWEYETAAVR